MAMTAMEAPLEVADVTSPAGIGAVGELPQPSSGWRSPLRGWVTKKKSEGSRSRILCRANRRYYTIDFDAQVVYYAHSETSKEVSAPMPFRDILGVEPTSNMMAPPDVGVPLVQENPNEAGLQRSDSKGSLGSRGSGLRRPRMPSLGALTRRPVEQYGLILRTVSKTSELFFDSRVDAEHWREAFQWALDLGSVNANRGEGRQEEPSTQPGSSRSTGTTVSTPTPRSLGEEERDMGDESSRPGSGRRADEDQPTPAGAQQQVDANAPRHAEPGWGAEEEEAAEATQALEEDIAQVVVPEADVPVQAPAAAPPHASPRGATAWGLGPGPDGSPVKGKTSRYADKAKGLNLQERLAQLEFSDDEEDDENDPLAAARKPSARTKQERAARSQAQQKATVAEQTVTFEECQAFEQEPETETDED